MLVLHVSPIQESQVSHNLNSLKGGGGIYKLIYIYIYRECDGVEGWFSRVNVPFFFNFHMVLTASRSVYIYIYGSPPPKIYA